MRRAVMMAPPSETRRVTTNSAPVCDYGSGAFVPAASARARTVEAGNMEPGCPYPDQADTASAASILPLDRPASSLPPGLAMNWPTHPPLKRHDVVTIPIIWIAIVLSLLVHVAAMWIVLPPRPPLAMDVPERGSTRALAVQLVPRPRPAVNAAASAPSSPSQPAILAAIPPPHERPVRPPRPAAPKRTTPPPVIAVPQPAPRPLPPAPPIESAPEPAPAVKPAPMPPAPATDLAAYVEARRRERGEATAASTPASGPSAAGDSDVERRNRIVAANLGLDRTPAFGHDARNAGGIFQIKELDEDAAQFYFFGFDKDIGRNAKQLIEVRRGDNDDIRIAVVRKMIGIIRENISGDFLWVSERMGRQVKLSARRDDNAALEDFILRDTFPGARLPRP
jgi:hypothetical protein